MTIERGLRESAYSKESQKMEGSRPEERLLDQARSELECWSQGDTEGYGKSAAPEITYFHNAPAGPRVDGADAYRGLLRSLKGLIPPHDFEIIDPKVQIYGDVGVFTLVYRAFSSDGGILAEARGTSVYRQVDGKWEMVHCHWSVLEDTAAS
jgi:ketosteroid isomerase-like protein